MMYRRRRTGHVTWVMLCLVALFLMGSTAFAKVKVGVENWGLGGVVKSGLWSQLYLELQSVGEDFNGVIEVEVHADQQVLPLFVKPITLVRDTWARHWVYFRTPGMTYRDRGRKFTWRVRDGDGNVVARAEWARSEALPVCDSVVAVMGGGSGGLGSLMDQQSEVRTNVRMLPPGMAPEHVIGYESADVLVWLNPDPDMLVSVAQRAAIVDYVNQGGHLVVAAGVHWQRIAKSFLGELLPAMPTASQLVEELPALNEYGPREDGDKKIVLMQLGAVRGEVLTRYDEHPVVVRGPVGMGRVTLVGFDPTLKPFSELEKRGEFWRRIVEIEPLKLKSSEVGSMQSVSIPLIRSLNEFPGFKAINFTFVGVFLLAYVILIGPVDYFVLKRLKKLHWTWLTFPVIAIVSSVLAFWLLSSGRVTELYTNSVSLVDANAESREIFGTTFTTMLSPRQKRYNVRVKQAARWAMAPREFSVMAGAGGMGMGQTKCYVLPGGRSIQDLLVRVWDAQTMEASWQAVAPDLPDTDITHGSDVLKGTVTNDTPRILKKAVLIYAGKVTQLGDIQPEESVKLDGKKSQRLGTYANGLTPRDVRSATQYYGYGELSAKRTNAEGAARWISLFGCAGKDSSQPCFRRWLPTDESHYSLAFDLPARLELTGFGSKTEAILMYSLDEALVETEFEGETPKRWDCTVVRQRVQVQ